MLSRSALPAGLALLGATRVLAGQATCSLENKCPEDTPCCSQYGQCGVGAYCLGGCDPRMSFSLDSCMPAPVCQDRTFKMDSLDGIVEIDKYLGDSSKADWVYQGEPILYNNNVLLTMPPNSVGTVLASTVYMWYGSVSAKLKTSRSAGVVTAFILLSDVKDEIDYEFVGTELTTAQTNYYFQGIPVYDNSANISLSDTYANWHEYEIRWTPDDITWLVDGQVGRVKKRSDTWNATTNQWDFPQTPARVQISIWPGGASSNAEGTVEWAGGPINWKDTPDMKSPGYYYATFGEINIQCYNATSPPGTHNGKSYTFNNVAATNNTVVDGNKDTVLSSFLATGKDPTKGATTSSGTASASSSSEVASIPGGSSSGTGSSSGASANQGSSGSGSGSGSSGSGSGSGSSSSSSSSSSCTGSSFSQNCGSKSSTSGSGAGAVAERMGASALAGVVAVAALLAL